MFLEFFLALREAGVPVSLHEYLTLLEALDEGLAGYDIESFYHLSRATLVKDERYFDRFDLVFGAQFGDKVGRNPPEGADVKAAWLRKMAEKFLSKEELDQLEKLGFDKLMELFKKRLAEQKERHQGGSKWIGTAGTSPFGAWGSHPEGIRIGQDRSRHQRAVKVWDRREFQNLDDDADLGPRNLKMALRRLRRFGREGAETELDLDSTVGATAKNGGHLDLRLRPERRNTMKVLLFLDAGGSMDVHVEQVTELFGAARAEFKYLESYYFHNCLYESVWRDNRRRWDDTIPTLEVLRTYGPDCRVIVVGDASMSPYELVARYGAVEHNNDEPGVTWLSRLRARFPHHVWLNPVRPDYWGYTASIGMVRELFEDRMRPLTLDGIAQAVELLTA